MSYVHFLTLIALGVLLASPAFPQSADSPVIQFTPRPVTITTAGGRSYMVGVQRRQPEPIETTPVIEPVRKSADRTAAKSKELPQ